MDNGGGLVSIKAGGPPSKPYTTSEPDQAHPSRSRTRPPFGYYGAKQRIASRIVESLPPHNAWVEAFCGSAAITFAKKPAPIEVINDLDGRIVNLFTQLRERPEDLCRAVALTPYAREEHQRSFNVDARATEDPLESARMFLVNAMMTVNSTLWSDSGFSFSTSYTREGREARVNRWYNLPERLSAVVERLRSVRVENRDARELVEMFRHRPATLMYLDPPYLVQRRHKYEVDALDRQFHKELLMACCKSRAMILISGYHNDLYDALLTKKRGWHRVDISTHTRDTEGTDYVRTEVLWRNERLVKALKTGRIPIRLTAQEKAQQKVNPPRTS